jgi:hypothetical protein
MSKDKALKKIMPSDLGVMDFANDIQNYRNLLDEEKSLVEQVAENRERLANFTKQFADPSYTYSNGRVEIRVYVTPPAISEKYRELLKNRDMVGRLEDLVREGSEFLSSLISKEELAEIKKLVKYHRATDKYSRKIDEEKTEAKRKEYEEILRVGQSLNDKLESVREKKKNARDFVGYVKDIATIASASKKGKK